MVVIFLVVAGVATLYLWLNANWFGRVLAFLALSLLGVLIAGNMPEGAPVALMVLVGAAWFTSGIPLYVKRYRLRLH